MNVIFLDFDGVLDTNYYKSEKDIEEKIAILANICHEYDCKVVIEASAKDMIDEETLEINPDSRDELPYEFMGDWAIEEAISMQSFPSFFPEERNGDFS